MHVHYNNRDTWEYDEKGNLVKYKVGDHVNEFKIYYK